MGGGPIHAPFGQAIADKMLGRGQHTCVPIIPLQAAHKIDPHLRDEVRVFAKGLFDPPPAWVTGHIYHGR